MFRGTLATRAASDSWKAGGQMGVMVRGALVVRGPLAVRGPGCQVGRL